MITILISVWFQLATLEFPVLPPPTPIPTSTPFEDMEFPDFIEDSQIYVSTLEAGVDSLPYDITRDENNFSLLPDDTRYSQLMGHLKWIVTLEVIGEVFGVFSGFGFILAALLTISFFGLTVFISVYTVILLAQGIIWLIDIVGRVIPGFGS